jgi:hypothetical protein
VSAWERQDINSLVGLLAADVATNEPPSTKEAPSERMGPISCRATTMAILGFGC